MRMKLYFQWQFLSAITVGWPTSDIFVFVLGNSTELATQRTTVATNKLKAFYSVVFFVYLLAVSCVCCWLSSLPVRSGQYVIFFFLLCKAGRSYQSTFKGVWWFIVGEKNMLTCTVCQLVIPASLFMLAFPLKVISYVTKELVKDVTGNTDFREKMKTDRHVGLVLWITAFIEWAHIVLRTNRRGKLGSWEPHFKEVFR